MARSILPITVFLMMIQGKAYAQDCSLQKVINNAEGSGCNCCTITNGFVAGNIPIQEISSGAECGTECSSNYGSEFFLYTPLSLCDCINGGSVIYDFSNEAGYASGMKDGTAFGDPHIMKWNGDKYDFHGECDLVLIQAPDFANGLGLDVHIRTTIQNSFSYIEELAVKAGHLVANVNTKGVWIDNELLTDFPAQHSYFQVTRKDITDKKGNDIVTYELFAAGHKAVRVKIPADTKFVFVAVVRYSQLMMSGVENFGTSEGLMGQYGTGKTFGRDGMSEFEDMNAFGMEWQVQSYEDMLFLTVREPQFPQVCNMPVRQSDTKRILGENPGLRLKAEEACDDVDDDMVKYCVEDVVATGDFSIAAGY